MTTPQQWLAGARPRTLTAAVAPVLVGTAAAAADPNGADLGRAGLALVVALALQVAVNYANDYSDGIRGTDDQRIGPMRLTGSGAASAAAVKRAALLSFAVAAIAGLALVALSGTWWLLGVGALAIVAAWFYTGGKKPYGYLGLGEVMVFVFFGLVAVLGTEYTQSASVSVLGFLGAVGIGFLACAILVANNLRDIPTDALHGKKTLAVRLGSSATRTLFQLLVAGAFVAAALALSQSWGPGVALACTPLAVPTLRKVRRGNDGPALLAVLAATAKLELLYALAWSLGVAIADGGMLFGVGL